MSSGSLARRYARALLAIGLEEKNLEQLGKEVRGLAAAIAESDELAETLSNPAFPRSDREKVLVAVLDRLKAKKTTVNFTRLLLDRERVGVLPDISRELDVMIDDHAGRVRAVVTSAKPLTSAQLSRLVKALEKLSGKKILVETLEDTGLLGGVVAQVGDQVYDGSLRTQLRQLRGAMTA
jgi:F-type H+-transporting ATPase subunit delta